jgi:hypothetical protein
LNRINRRSALCKPPPVSPPGDTTVHRSSQRHCAPCCGRLEPHAAVRRKTSGLAILFKCHPKICSPLFCSIIVAIPTSPPLRLGQPPNYVLAILLNLSGNTSLLGTRGVLCIFTFPHFPFTTTRMGRHQFGHHK